MLERFDLFLRARKWHPNSPAVLSNEGIAELFGGMPIGHYLRTRTLRVAKHATCVVSPGEFMTVRLCLRGMTVLDTVVEVII